MISIEQIRILEAKVHAAVERIQTLNAENTTLRTKLAEYETRVVDLQKRVEGFQSDQAAIEAGILSALSQLDQLEDRIGADSDRREMPARADVGEEGSTQKDATPRADAGHTASASSSPLAENDDEEEEVEVEDPELDIF